MLGRPGLSQEKPGCPENVLLEVLLEIGVVLLNRFGIVGFPRCRSLTLKSRQSRQVPAGGMSPLVTPSSRRGCQILVCQGGFLFA